MVAGTIDELPRRRWWHLGGAVGAEVHAIVHVPAEVPDSIVVADEWARARERAEATRRRARAAGYPLRRTIV